ncbi:MAG: hypothetical protein JOZ73_08010 [Solirubrobacterales bacterium]|nr:hypothetical protein [Solirubrobacterales bacterium]
MTALGNRPRAHSRRWPLTSGGFPPTLAVGLLCLAAVGIADALLRHERAPSGDEPFYLRMANHPGAAHSFPYAYRVAVPLLVHALPFSHAFSFQLLALLAIAASGGVLYALLREFDVSTRLATAFALAFVLSPNLLVVLLRNGRSIDPATTLVMVLGCYLIVRRQKVWLALTIVVGVAVKETSLFLIPFAYAVWADSLVDRRVLRDVALIAVAPIALFIALRTSISAIGNQYVPGYGGSLLGARLKVFEKVFSGVELRRLAYALGPLWLVAPFALASVSFARRGLVLIALCFAAMAVSFDAGRIIFLAAPVFYVAAALVVDQRPRLALATVLAMFALDIGYALYMQLYGVQHGLDSGVSGRIPVY